MPVMYVEEAPNSNDVLKTDASDLRSSVSLQSPSRALIKSKSARQQPQQQDFALFSAEETHSKKVSRRTSPTLRRNAGREAAWTWLGPYNRKVLVAVCRSAPAAILIPLLLFLVCAGLGLFGVLEASRDWVRVQRDTALELALDASRQMELQMLQAFSPTIALEIVIQQKPHFPELIKDFDWVAQRLLSRVQPGTLQSLQLAPGLVNQAIYPLKGNEAALGHDLLADATRREDTLKALAARNLTVAGPYRLLQGGFGVVVRLPVYIAGQAANETFGANASVGSCPPGLCWDAAAGLRLWGFVQGLARLDRLIEGMDDRMKRLQQYGPWSLTRVFDNGTEALLAASYGLAGPLIPGRHPVSVPVSLPNAAWRLYLAKRGGWAPAWRHGLLALVVCGAAIVSALLAALLVGWQRHRALLAAMFPAKVLAPLQQGHNFSEEFDSVSILFSDIVSYTSISSELRPIEVAEMLNELYCEFDNLVDKNGCYKIETIGDAFMAVGGCPLAEPPEAAAERVARMAIDMLHTAAGFRSAKGHRLRIRVGIHSGPAAAAVIGRKMPRYCLFGDTVNLASRMESTSLPMRIHTSAATAELLRRCSSAASFALEPRGQVAIKGKGAMDTAWLTQAAPANSGGTVALQLCKGGGGGAATAAAAANGAGAAAADRNAGSLADLLPAAAILAAHASAASASGSPSRLLESCRLFKASDAQYIDVLSGASGGGGSGPGGLYPSPSVRRPAAPEAAAAAPALAASLGLGAARSGRARSMSITPSTAATSACGLPPDMVLAGASLGDISVSSAGGLAGGGLCQSAYGLCVGQAGVVSGVVEAGGDSGPLVLAEKAVSGPEEEVGALAVEGKEVAAREQGQGMAPARVSASGLRQDQARPPAARIASTGPVLGWAPSPLGQGRRREPVLESQEE